MPHKIVILGYSDSVHIIRWARGIAERGFDVAVISLGGSNIENIRTFVIPSGRKRSIGYINNIPRVKGLIKDIKPDLVHTHFATGFGLWGLYSGFHPHLVSVWGADVIDFPRTMLRRFLLRRILNSADYITATSHFLQRRTLKLSLRLESKITVVPFGINIPAQVESRPPDGIIRLAYIKAHREKYGPGILLEAIHIAINENRKVHLTMAGEGELTGWLKARAAELGLEQYVSFAGFIDNKQMPGFLANHDIMVMPSVMESESFGVAVIEASAVGLPVIASDIGGVPEVLLPGKTGIMVPPGDASALADAVIRLADNAELRRKMGEEGRKFVTEKYRWQDSLDSMTGLYERLISREIKR